MSGRLWLAALALSGTWAGPVAAEVKESSDGGFSVSSVRTVTAAPQAVWAKLVQPALWWSPEHSWSGDAKNFSLEPVAGGCFCERWGVGNAASSVEHARIVYAAPGGQLRMVGALGPLQGEAVAGTLTFTLKAEGAATRITVDYVVGGHARFPLRQIADGVDQVIAGQVTRLAALFPAAE